MGNITKKSSIRWDDLAYTSDTKDIEKYLLDPGVILFNRTNSKEWVGKTTLFDGLRDSIYAGCIVRFHPLIANAAFINQVLCAPYGREWCNRVKTDGVNQSNINVQKLKHFLVPIPPLAEQQRIVAALDSLLAHVDAIEREQAELDGLLAKTRSKILDLAIRGKLVPQDPADEPASVLLERIHAKKLQVVADGKLKKKDVADDSVIYQGDDNSHHEKVGGSTPNRIDDELPFALPEKWYWSRLRSICLPQIKAVPKDAFRYIDIDSIDNVNHRIREPKQLHASTAPSRAQRAVYASSSMFSMVRPYLENTALVGSDNEDCIASTGFYVCTPIEVESAIMLFFTLISPYAINLINMAMKGNNSPSVRKDDMDSLLVPVPPLTEQQRIVSTLDALPSSLKI